MSRKEEAEHLLKRSKEFLETAEYQISRGLYGIAVFSLEQALQLFLKSKMLIAGVDYPRTHGVRTLLEILSDVESDEKKRGIKHMLNDYLLELGMLEDAYITSRYVMREFTSEEAQRLAKTVKEVMNNVK
ncbi:MAG: HEPN domain-containing protein [Candidatus Bathyarchaeia archaeon]